MNLVVFLNIIIKATYTSTSVNKEIATVQVKTWDKDNKVFIVISDNVTGVPYDVAQKILNPFVTTKSIGVETGMGLVISYQIIENDIGMIELMHSPLGGATSVISIACDALADKY